MSSRSRRFAIVIGNGAYHGQLELQSPLRDAAQMASNLEKLDFDVTLATDQSFDAINASLDSFITRLRAGLPEAVLFYFSGHGVQIDGHNYIVPIDFDHASDEENVEAVQHSQAADHMIDVQSVIDRLAQVSSKRIILLDACRTGDSDDEKKDYVDRFSKRIANKSMGASENTVPVGEVKSKFVEMEGAENTFIAFATASGQVAYEADEAVGEILSPFTAAFIKYMDSVDLPLTNLTSRVRVEVLRLTNKRQNTWDQSSLTAPFLFNPGSLLLFFGNAMALVGFFLALIPYSLLLTTSKSWSWIATSAALPLICLAILLFGMQSAYSRLRGSLDTELDGQITVFDHLKNSLQKGSLGGYLGSFFAGLGIGIPYYLNWANYDASQPGIYDRLEPLGALLLEITVATALTACILGSLSLFFMRAGWMSWRFVLSPNRSALRTVAGSIIGGILTGLLVGPALTVYFGLKSRPDMVPMLLIPGGLFGSGFIIFSIVNFDFERLTLRRIRSSVLAALAALGMGIVVATVVMGFLSVVGAVRADTNWLHQHSHDYWVLAAGGAIYGIPVGAILGSVIGAAITLTEKWSEKPVVLTNLE
jgi:uncharacterized caspase-like protein